MPTRATDADVDDVACGPRDCCCFVEMVDFLVIEPGGGGDCCFTGVAGRLLLFDISQMKKTKINK